MTHDTHRNPIAMPEPIFLADTDLRALAEARVLLERPSLAARLSSFVGSPLEKGMARLPASWRERIGGLAHDALMKAMDAAAKTLQPTAQPASPRLHKLLGSVSGAGGGAFGVAGLTVEIVTDHAGFLALQAETADGDGDDRLPTTDDRQPQVGYNGRQSPVVSRRFGTRANGREITQ